VRSGSGNDRQRPDAGDLYELFASRVLAYLRAQGAPDCEDLLGEVFLQIARDLPRFRGDDDEARRWVFTIARNRLIDERRRRSRRASLPLKIPVPDGTCSSAPEPFDPVLVEASTG
jgi:DNA-directed RNA polymerase specialized sigma24 family protein